ncbi:MAG: hypothetical protein LBU51_11120 [Bacteroidales bacterium]|nr:hypothetical protein [Bacteroidales bacterium]
MVKDTFIYPSDCIDIVTRFFSQNFHNFKLNRNGYYTGYWWIEYKNDHNDIVVYFDGDIGGHFCVYIYIYGTKYSLWQYDKSVNTATLSTEQNIIYQLNVLKRFLNEVGYGEMNN